MPGRTSYKLTFSLASLLFLLIGALPYGMVATYAAEDKIAEDKIDENEVLKYFFLPIGASIIKNTTSFCVSRVLKKNYYEIYQKQYINYGVYDSGLPGGFFIPLKQFRPYYAWWDTHILLMGSGIGARQVLQEKWCKQSWFVGLYGYYDVVSDVGKDMILAMLQYTTGNKAQKSSLLKVLPHRLLCPIRWNIGGEVGGSDWGQLTINGYGMLMPDADLENVVRERGGVSAKLALNLYPKFKPFVCGGISLIEREYEVADTRFIWKGFFEKEKKFQPEYVKSIAIGFRCGITSRLDCELKYFLYESHPYQMPLHIGLQFKYGAFLYRDSFQGRIYQPPDRYIPCYPEALKLNPLLLKTKVIVNRYIMQAREDTGNRSSSIIEK